MKVNVNRVSRKLSAGSPLNLGPVVTSEGCNFAVFSSNASTVSLLLFDDYRDGEPSDIISLDPVINRTGDIWHVFIYGVKEGQCYGYTADGPYDPAVSGHRFNVNKLLIDPYSRAVSGSCRWNEAAAYGYSTGPEKSDLSFSNIKNYNSEVKSIVLENSSYDWEGDLPIHVPMCRTVIYETHVRAFTRDKSSGVKHPGTYPAMIEKLPYLKDLGITTIELLPLQEFNEEENILTDPVTGVKLKNFWGYSPLAFFALETWFSTSQDGRTAVVEFRDMVKAYHRAGIEVVMDVVFNHTGEGNEYGPTLSFRGLDNAVYYMLEEGRGYKNYSGCGNTLNCSHVVVKNLIKDCLHYWVVDMHVDGFRFDLAAILGRDSEGRWMPDYSILMEITQDPILAGTKIIAEGWDTRFFQVGGFPSGWSEWNARYRDDVRSFIKGDCGKATDFINAVSGSPGLFRTKYSNPYKGINFITAHDGFTLCDLVSYNNKHNERNGENNNDGNPVNFSWNCGFEGETSDIGINELRLRQSRNLFTVLMVSLGTPMIAGGDEMLFSKKGNNNTYCHDNELNWLDWGLMDKNREFFEFCRFMIYFRKHHRVFHCMKHNMSAQSDESEDVIIERHGVKPFEPDISEDSHSIAFMLRPKGNSDVPGMGNSSIYYAVNAYWKELGFTVPEPSHGKKWRCYVDTGSKKGFFPDGSGPHICNSITLMPRSIIILAEE